MNKSKNIIKGAPSGFVVSLLVHAAAFLLAGLLVVFSVTKKKEQKFVPPTPVERPKMKLKKPKVKVKKNAKPKSSSRIVTKIDRAQMPDIHLPEMSGMSGEGVGSGFSGFDISPNLEEISMLGSKVSIGNDLEGTYYDTKRGRDGRNISAGVDDYRHAANLFFRKGWRRTVFSRFYQAPQKLYTQAIVIPETMATMAPLAFADEDGVGALWLVHYTGKLVHKDGIRFRFWGSANEFLVVRVNKEIVLAACWNDDRRGVIVGNLWESDDMRSDKWYWGRGSVQIGDWITLEPGVPLDIEILLGDNGASTGFMLAVEEDGVEYEKSGQGAPILPAFKTADLSRDYLDTIFRELPEGEVCLTNGPVFRDY